MSTKASSSRACTRALVLGPLALLPPACNGTEADNPFADVINTPCKGDDEYDPALEQADWDALRAKHMPAAAANGYGRARAASTSPRATPIGLQCLEWKLVGLQLELHIENFSDGCSIVWEGGARVEGDLVAIDLRNPACSVAACFSCLYNTGTIVTLPALGPVTLQLSADSSCDGMPQVTTWQLPLDTQPSGMTCVYANPISSSIAASSKGLSGEEFSVCGGEPDGITCNSGYDCRDVQDLPFGGKRCLKPCTSDSECNFAGGVACRAGYCAL